MTRANLAIFRSRSIGLADKLHLSPAEVIDVTLRLAVDHAAKAGQSAGDLHARIDDACAALAVEGDNGGGHAE